MFTRESYRREISALMGDTGSTTVFCSVLPPSAKQKVASQQNLLVPKTQLTPYGYRLKIATKKYSYMDILPLPPRTRESLGLPTKNNNRRRMAIPPSPVPDEITVTEEPLKKNIKFTFTCPSDAKKQSPLAVSCPLLKLISQ